MLIYYFVKMIAIQVLGLLIYYLILRGSKLFTFSRSFLWFTLLSSFIIPFISPSLFLFSGLTLSTDAISNTVLLPEVNITFSQANTIGFYEMLIVLYILITLVFIVRLVIAYTRILDLKKGAQVQAPNIFWSKDIDLPFSFLNYIFIPNSFEDNEALSLILAHENAHVRMKHSWDKIIITFISSICWFNPLIRIFHRELELIHEFQVDETVILKYPKEKYLETLLQTTIYTKRNTICLTHSFFSSPIKNRIIMLYKNTKNPMLKKMTSGLAILAILFVTLCFQSNISNAQAQTQEEVNPPVPPPPPPAPPAPPIVRSEGSEMAIKKLIKEEDVLERASFPGGEKALIEYLKRNLKYPAEAKKAGMEGKLMVQFTVGTDGSIENAELANIDIRLEKKVNNVKALEKSLEKEALRVVNAMPKWNPAVKADGTNIKGRYTMPIVFKVK